MPIFDSTKTLLRNLLDQIVEGKIQLPDFQRGWVWDDDHIRSLLVSIARGFPIGSIMLLESGGEARFQIKPVEGVTLGTQAQVERLILDGQQRLTALTQVLRLVEPVSTRDSQKRGVARYYYIDIEKALQGPSYMEDAIIGVDETRTIRRDFGREVVMNLGSQEHEFEQFYFPCNQILNSDHWEQGLINYDLTRFRRYMQFRQEIIEKFREYQIPVIELDKNNSKEGVCLVFEKVNTGGVPLSVFELVTATYAADGFNLRKDWFGDPKQRLPGRQAKLATRPLLCSVEATDFLQGVSLLHSYTQHQEDLRVGRTGREVTAVSAKREQVLALPLAAYQRWMEPLTVGFLAADQFLRREGFRSLDYLPYRTQLVPLAAIMVRLGERWQEPVIYSKLARWFWCGVFGELYGGAVETRIALDMQDLIGWIDQPGVPEPSTIVSAGFQASRLDTLRTRTSAAYRGLYVLLQREGCRDFFWKARVVDLDTDEYTIDIHHIFPREWCTRQGISDRTYNAIVNKTPISYKANRMIGGAAPSHYLDGLRRHAQVQMSAADQDAILRTHLIDPSFLRADDFQGFYERRKQALIRVIENAMGKPIISGAALEPVDDGVEELDS